MTPPPPRLARPLPIVGSVKAAWSLVRQNPRETILPSLLIPVPVAIVVAVVTAILYFTAFKDDTFKAAFTELDRDDSGGLVFVLIVGAAVQALFAQVARGATIAVVWGILSNRRVTVVAALDVAFTRMGALLLMALIVYGALGIVSASIVVLVGLVLLPIALARTAVTFETLIIEKTSVGAALRKSWRISQGYVLRLCGALVFGVLTVLPIIIVLSVPELLIAGSRTQEVVASAVVMVVQAVVVAPALAFFTALTTILYSHLREGYDDRRPV